MPALADRPFQDLLEDVAAERPAPGGGAASAWGCALAAGLVEMSAAFTGAGEAPDVLERMSAIRRRAEMLRGRLLELAELDMTAYAPVLGALRLPAEDAQRRERLAAALSAAADSPLAIAEAAAEIAELAAEAARDGNRHLRGDAVTGALLAEASCRAAGRLVEINLAGHRDDARLASVATFARRADAARQQALA